MPVAADNFRREAYWFAAQLAPGASQEFAFRVPKPGTLEGILLRFYPNSNKEVQLTPYIQRKPDRPEVLVHLIGEDNKVLADPITGEDDTVPFDIQVPLDTDDEIRLIAKNTSGTIAKSFYMKFEIDYAGGAFPREAIVHG